MADWLADARAALAEVQEELGEDSIAVWETPLVNRLLDCAEALAELVALHEGSQTQRPSRWETAWERARQALGGGDG